MTAKVKGKLSELLKSGKPLELKNGQIRAIAEKNRPPRERPKPVERPKDFWD